MFDDSDFLYGFFNNTLVDAFAFNAHLNIAAAVPIRIFLFLDFDWCIILVFSFDVLLTHHRQVRVQQFRAPWFWLFWRWVEVFWELFHHLLHFGWWLWHRNERVYHIFENILAWGGFFCVWDVPAGSVLLVGISLLEIVSVLATSLLGFVICLVERILNEFLFSRWHF